MTDDTGRLYDRWKRITVSEDGPGRLLFCAYLEDDAHQMELELLVQEDTGEVLSAHATMTMVPYGDRCRAALPALERLVGHRIGPGSTKEAFRLAAGPAGCTHVAELVIDAFRAFVPTIGVKAIRRWRAEFERAGCPADVLEQKVRDNVETMGRSRLPDTCIVYAVGGSPSAETGRSGAIVEGGRH